MEVLETLMKIVVKVTDVVALARQFRETPGAAMQQLAQQVRSVVTDALEHVMDAELELHLGEEGDPSNKRNGYRERSYALKGVGAVTVRVPRDRKGTFESRVVPPSRRYDEAIERDLATLHLAGISTRMLAMLSRRVMGVRVSAQEVSNAMQTLVPAAKRFLERPLGDRRWVYLYVDGTNFRVRRSTVAIEPTLVVLGVDEQGHKSVLAMVQGDKDARGAWEVVFQELKNRGLDGSAVQLGIMDGLPGLASAFREAFPNARAARCWVHKRATSSQRCRVSTRLASDKTGTVCSTPRILRAPRSRSSPSKSAGRRTAATRWRASRETSTRCSCTSSFPKGTGMPCEPPIRSSA